jgi:biopolymer transport protein ExbD
MKISITPQNKTLSSFSYSSLTDIVLLLLVFFLLTSSFIVNEGLKVILPEAVNAQTVEEKQIIVNLLEDGRTFLNGDEIAIEDLQLLLKDLLIDPETQVVVLASDKAVPLDRAVFVLDQAKGIGALRFLISTTQGDEQE